MVFALNSKVRSTDISKAMIRESDGAEFTRRLNVIEPSLDRVRDLLKFVMVAPGLSESRVYLAGGCAAWLLGRTSEFGDIDVFITKTNVDCFNSTTSAVAGTIESQTHESAERYDIFNVLTAADTRQSCANKNGYEYAIDRDSKYGYRSAFRVFDVNPNSFSRFKVQLVFTTANVCDMLRNFDINAIATAMNLYDYSDILMSECECFYESYVRRDHHADQSVTVVYPLVFDSTDRDWIQAAVELRENERAAMRFSNPPNAVQHIGGNRHLRSECSRKTAVRLGKYAKRLAKPNLSKTSSTGRLSFCVTGCKMCVLKETENDARKAIPLFL